MKNRIIVMIIIFVGVVSITYSQQLFRKAAFLHQSVGGHIYHHGGASTDVPAEIIAYNTTHNFTGDSAVSMYNPTDDYPPGGNQIWKWWDAFRDAPGYSFKEDYLETSDYNVLIIKECFASQSDIWFYWYEGPQDTTNYPYTQSIYNYQWYARKIAHKMEEYPNKFFVWWTIPPMVPGENSNVADMQRLRWYNKWMVDTLAAGLDTLYGDFPPNIYIYDYFELVDSANFLPLSLADSWTDSHPNAACSELVAPDFVEKTFNAAIAYETTVKVEGELNNNQIQNFKLEQNYPNPFNPTTTIKYQIPEDGQVKLIIYNLLGQEIKTLVDDYKYSGSYNINFDGGDLDSGVYIYKIEINGLVKAKKMALLK